jgi:lipopolysaccharide transport protein LptA
MAVSIPNRATRLVGAAACIAACAPGWGAAPAPKLKLSSPGPLPKISKIDSTLPISVEAQSSEFDYKNSTLEFRKVKITQGTMSVAADQAQASGLNFVSSRWSFHGKVRMAVEQGFLTSDDAEITFANKLLSKAVITGKPAEFEQRNSKTDQTARGRAQSIVYDAKLGMVDLTHDAWLTDGQYEIRGDQLKYSVRDQHVLANTPEQGSQRVHITITPPPKSK